MAVVLALAMAGPAQAYVGPGAGVTLIGAAIGLIVAVVVALGVVIMWPLRRAFKRKRAGQADAAAASAKVDPD